MFHEEAQLEDITVAFNEGRIYINHKGHGSDSSATR